MKDARHQEALRRLRHEAWRVSLADLDVDEVRDHPLRALGFALLGRLGYRLVRVEDLKTLRAAMDEEYDAAPEPPARSTE